MTTLTEFKIDGWSCLVEKDEHDGSVWYDYQREGEDAIGFRFSLLCEVGESFVPWFRAALRRAHYSVTNRTKNLRDYPYVTDVLRKLPHT